MPKKHKPSRLSRVSVPLSNLENQMKDQIGFLEHSCLAFDSGNTAEYKRIALAIRVMAYDSNSSHSLLSQLNMKDEPFISYSTPNPPGNLVAWHPLVMMRIGDGDAAFVPVLNQGHKEPRSAPFKYWWDESVFHSPDGIMMTRGDFITIVANQDGGAHVDPELDERYHKLANENLAGWIASGPDGETPLLHLEKMHLRHIGHECLISLQAAWAKRIGNRFCECKSGRKFRYCHGKAAAV